MVNTKGNLKTALEQNYKTHEKFVLWCPEELSIGFLNEDLERSLKEKYNFITITNKQWPMFWATKTVYENLFTKKILPTHSTPDRMFITLNGKTWGHRCQFIDKLAEYNLLEKGYYSWNNWNELNPAPYSFQYFNGKQKLLDNPTRGDYYNLPREWKQSLFSVVCETNIGEIFLTEKLWNAIYHHRPFICYAAKGYHQHLKEMGFELFEEVIDYSFDNENKSHVRLDMMADQVQRICEYRNIPALQKALESKTQHNFKHMMKLIDKERYFDEIWTSNYLPVARLNTLQKFKSLL